MGHNLNGIKANAIAYISALSASVFQNINIHFAKHRDCFFFFWQPCVSALSAFSFSDSKMAAIFL